MEYKIKTHTVILMVGPSGCGKSTFSKRIKTLVKDSCALPWRDQTNVQYLSSDDMRRDLLGSFDYGYEKHTPQMMQVSEQAFDLLYKKLELVTSYPVNAEIAIVDTTGLNAQFRDRIIKIARAANYHISCVVFDYKNRDDYYKYLEGTHDLTVVSAQLSRFHRETLGQLRKRDFDNIFYVKKKDFDDIDIEIEDALEYQSRHLPSHLEYPVIGDIHGCYDELLKLLDQLKFTVVDGKITDKPSAKVPIICGDFIDGPNPEGIERVINFLYENRDQFKFVTGNHENFVYSFMKGKLDAKSLPPSEVIDTHFPTTHLLTAKPELAEKFYVLRELSKDFYVGYNFIVTHSPCPDSALGKMHPAALKQQRNFRYPHRQEGESLAEYSHRFEDALSFLKEAAAHNKPYHIFGHCRMQNVARVKNKIGIDTGVCQGNRLTSASVVGSKVFFQSIQSEMPKNEELPEVFTKKDAATEILPDVNLEELDSKEISRIHWAAKNKVNYISGTMSPSDKDLENEKLESVAKALEYFRSKDVESVCLQPKYMGSRAELFLNCKDLSQSYTTTRRGYIIDRVDLKAAYEKVHAKVGAWAQENDFEWVLLDCELMPWFALGKNLIETQYMPCQHGIESEISLLEECDFEEQLQKLFAEYDEVGYAKLSSQLSKEKLRQQLTSHKCATYEAIRGFQWIPLSKQDEYFATYKRQLELFAQPAEIEFKPFALLKGIRSDGTEKLFFDMPNSEQFSLVSDDVCLVVNLKYDEDCIKAEEFFNDVVGRELEGVVIKPEQPYIKGVAPYMKVRNPHYLAIIYSYDYTFEPKYQKLLRQKKITRKLATSIDEFEYGKRMLEIPRSEISKDNKAYVSLVAKMILEEKKEERFDPRL
jgi:predicted kinase